MTKNTHGGKRPNSGRIKRSGDGQGIINAKIDSKIYKKINKKRKKMNYTWAEFFAWLSEKID